MEGRFRSAVAAALVVIAIFAIQHGVIALADGGDDPQSALATASLVADGDWKTAGKPPQPAAWWALDLHREGENMLRGRVMLNNSPLGSMGNVEGQIDGSQVAGTIKDDDGTLIANFTGTVSELGFQGQYVDRTGETGEWRWSGTSAP